MSYDEFSYLPVLLIQAYLVLLHSALLQRFGELFVLHQALQSGIFKFPFSLGLTDLLLEAFLIEVSSESR